MRGRLYGALVLVAIGLAAWLLFSIYTVRGGMRSLIDGDTAGAETGFQRARSLKLLRGGATEGAALLALAAREYGAAASAFDEADRCLLRLSGLQRGKWPVFARGYLAQGDYRALEILCRYLQQRGVGGDEQGFYHGCALCGLNRLEEARRALAPLLRPGISPFGDRARQLMDLTEERARRGRFAALLDRGGIPLAELDLESGRLEGLGEGIDSLLGRGTDNRGGLDEVLGSLERNNITVLTIDGDLQRAAHQALDGKPGAIVVLDPLSGDLLAVAANGAAQGPNPALGRLYEPASVIKLITLAAALREGPLERFDLFPFQCQGNTVIEGKLFYDWRSHGGIPHVEHAMAVSCNLVFARLGMLLGQARMLQELEYFGFGKRLEGRLLPMELGVLQGNPGSTWDLARLSVGLDFLGSTPLHLALVAAVIANNGRMMQPRLLLRRENILGEVMTGTAPVDLGTIIEPRVAAALTDAMFEVVESAEGTGRRAAIDGLDLAMKTGTGGDRTKGLDGIVMGFAPAHEPRVAFCVVLEGEGKAELAAAQASRRFLEAVLYKLELLRGDQPR
jgi:peptidoglycan glycosyltransferase